MKQKFTSALSLALILSMLFTSVGLADNVINDVVAGGNDTITSGGSTIINYRIQQTGAGNDGQANCNASDGSPATVTINTPTGVTVDTSGTPGNQVTLTYTTCGDNQPATFTSSTPGNYTITVSVSDSGVGTYSTSQATFTLHVLAPPKQNQSIVVDTAAPGTAAYGSSFTVAAHSTSGLPVAITTGGSCTGSGSNSASITMDSSTGTCTVYYNQAGDSAYNPAAQVTNTTAAQKANALIDVDGYSVLYDGDLHTATGTATGAKGEDLSSLLDLSGTTHTNAGSYLDDTWTFAGDANYNSANGTVDNSIGQAPVTATAGSGSDTYDGTAKSPSACVVSGDYTGDLSCDNDPTSVGPAAGTYVIAPVVSGTGLTNFDIDLVNGSFTIGKAATTTTVTCGAGPFSYTGSAIEPCTAIVTGPDGLSQSVPVTYQNNVNAGTATAIASYAESANYLGSSDSETFSIGKAVTVTTVTCGTGPFTYNGSAHTPCSATVTGPGGLSEFLTVNYSNNVAAGTATASASYAETANYQASSDSETFTIGKATTVTTVTCGAGPFTYNGSAHTPCTATVTGPNGLDETLPVSYSNNVDAGTATASASYAESANYLGSTDSENFTIGKATTVTTVTCDDGPFTFNGSAHTPCSASVTGPGELDEPLTVSYSNNVNAGTATASASYAESDNYLGSSDTESFTIDKAATTTTVSCPASVTYNGSAQTPCSAVVTGPGGLNQTLSVSYTDNTNAGTATASASYAESDNYLASSDSKNFTINKAATTTTVSCGAGPFTYNGSAHTPCTASVTGAGGLNQTLTVSYEDNVDAGTATASASYAESANYLASDDSEAFTIEKAATTTTVSCPENVTYDGSAQEPCTATVTGPGGLNQSLTVSYEDNVNAGTATASASYAESANYLSSNDSETFTIDKAPTTTLVSCPASETYTGSPLTPCTAAVTGAGGLNESLTVSYEDNVNAGTATASASYTESANYLASSDSETFTIDKAPSITTVTCPANVTYTGAALEPCTASYSGAGGLSGSLPVSYDDNIDAGTATASASYDGDANHLGSSDSKTFTIDKAPSVTTVTCPTSVTYSGSAQTPCSATVTGAGGLNQSLTVSYSNNVNPGTNTATASASYAGDANHLGSSDSKSFSILYSTGMCMGSPGHTILQPINTDGSSVFKQGSTVPAKFRVCDANGVSIGTTGVVNSFRLIQVMSGTAADTVNEPVDSTTPYSEFRWSPVDQQWIFNISTKSLTRNKTYVYLITLNDGTTIQFQFGLK